MLFIKHIYFKKKKKKLRARNECMFIIGIYLLI